MNVQPKDTPIERKVGASYSISFEDLLSNDSCKNIIDISIYSMVCKSFESIKEFIHSKNIKLNAEEQTWYQFARHIRNAFSHNFKWSFSNQVLKELNKSPVCWKKRKITGSMHGEDIEGFLSYFDALQLNTTMILFLEQHLPRVKPDINNKNKVKKIVNIWV